MGLFRPKDDDQRVEDEIMEELLAEEEGIPPIESRLRHNILRMPKEIEGTKTPSITSRWT